MQQKTAIKLRRDRSIKYIPIIISSVLAKGGPNDNKTRVLDLAVFNTVKLHIFRNLLTKFHLFYRQNQEIGGEYFFVRIFFCQNIFSSEFFYFFVKMYFSVKQSCWSINLRCVERFEYIITNLTKNVFYEKRILVYIKF
jgi:hypothetical protein